ncbi:MAG: MogA/MoaB family molybdenum cofactor biosynthesis protein [Chloroflexi bacterium]|nr:MogA/MoaB family molybdenum cofactor biosynthesis protein [Chloroflexota bacterium]
MKIGILTISDKGSRGEREDKSGEEIRSALRAVHAEVAAYEIVPDEADVIAATLRRWADVLNLDVVLTTGGTGLSPRDVTPEATRAVLHKEAPGIAEAMRLESLKKTPRAMLSRAAAGVRGQTLIVNLPGSPKAVREMMEVISPVLLHAVEIIQGRPTDHG